MRIPKALAEEVSIREGSAVDLSVSKSDLVIRPLAKRYELADLLAEIHDDNLHREIATGDRVGLDVDEHR